MLIQLEINPLKFTLVQWLNVILFALTTLAAAAWWQVYVSVQTVALITGFISWLMGIINFVTNGATIVPNKKTK